jgi:hypothetical protein
MTPEPDDLPPLPGRGEAMAQEVATLLEPVLAQLGHQLDAISAQLEAMLARPDAMRPLAGVAAGCREAIDQLIVLSREFPAWAVWLPYQGRPWVAARAASSRVPGPGLPMVWVDAISAPELAARMRAVDGQLAS